MTPTHTDSSDDAQFSTDDLAAGDRVLDRDADPDDRNLAVVVERPDAPAYACEIPALGASVADVNPDYPASGSVATIAFVGELDDALDAWHEADPEALTELCEGEGVRTYSYPCERLREVSSE